MVIETARFGKLEPREAQIMLFPEGLLGFAGLKRFVRIAPDDSEPLEYLQPLDEPRLAFPVLNPYLVDPGFDFELKEADQSALGLAPGGELVVLCVATLGRRPEEATLNLLAPVLINPDSRRGRQVVLEDSKYSVAEPIFAPR